MSNPGMTEDNIEGPNAKNIPKSSKRTQPVEQAHVLAHSRFVC